MLKQFKFWNNFARYFIILAVFGVLALSSQQSLMGELWQRGPVLSLADNEDYNVLGPANPGYQDGQTPLDLDLGPANPAYQDGQTPITQPVPQVASCVPTMTRLNPECDWNTSQVYEVQQNSCTGEYLRYNYHFQNGACGYNPAQPAQPATPAVPALPVTGPQTMTVCNGQVKTWDQLQAELRVAGYPGPWDQGSSLAAYNRAACPVSQPVAPAPVAAPQTLTVCNGQVKTWDQLQAELRVAGYPGPWDQGSSFAAYNRAACPVALAPRPQPIPAAPPVIVAQAQCPVGTYLTMSGSAVVCVSQQQTQQFINNNVNTNTNTVTVAAAPVPQVVYATAPVVEPKVVYVASTDAKQLPKTGLPLAAWFISGLLPVGMKLKRFGQSEEGSVGAGLQIWQTREMLRQ